ncbi:hypothetical protein HF521_006573 [Silurus meridionalis]|uniref:Alpha-2-macroglobulin-like protein 1 n=1 Tax=Silurus meridionalis TaxID=175797 RepID=A0A8T0ARU6_SILME|nr:hypothetical protein HF521_006573 [Silurus meridionalis]
MKASSTDTPPSEKVKDKHTAEAGKDKDKHTSDSRKDEDKHTADSGKGKDKHTSDSGKKEDKHTSDSGKDKDKHTADSGKDKDKHTADSGKDKDKHTSDSGKDRDKHTADSGKDKDKHTSDSGKDKDKHTADSGKDKDKHTGNSGKDKDKHTADSGKDKDKHTADSGKDKDKHTGDSGKDKDKHTADSRKDKDKHTADSGKDKDKHTGDSGKDKDKHTADSGKDKDKHTADSGKDKDKHTGDSGKHKDKHTGDSGKDKDKHTADSGKDKDKHTADSGKDKDKHTADSGKDKDKKHLESDKEKDSFYLLAVTSQSVGGTAEMLCVIVNPIETVALDVNLEYNQNNVTILKETSITQQYYNCIAFQVPVVDHELVASIKIQIKGSKKVLNKTTKILITPPSHLIIIHTDKPIYKPGQTVKFRIVSLDTNFLTYNQTFPTIEMQDPNSNRIGQWLNVATNSGLVDLSYPINSEATKGFYVITVWDDKNQQITQTFEVKDYVLPTFEVTVQLPPVITILDTTATLKVCAKYIYGKPVSGTVKAMVCHNKYRYGRLQPPPNICRNYTMKTGKTGCGVQILNLTEFEVKDSRYAPSIIVQSQVEEDETGVIMTGSGSSSITSNMVTLSFDDSPTIYKPGIAYEGKIKVLGPKSNPMKRKVVYLTINYSNNKKVVRKLVTGDKGIAKFSLNTEPWGLAQLSLQAQYEKTSRPVIKITNQHTPNYPTAYLSLQPFYSKSQSFIKLRTCVTIFSCIKKAVIRAQYLIHQSALAPHQKYITFFYMVMSKGHLYQQGRILQAIKHGKAEHKGNLVVTLQNVVKLSPAAQVVLYTILPIGEAIADSATISVQPCLANNVSLEFVPTTELPGDQASLMLRASPGSLCSLKAIDESLLLLQPEKELSIQSVFNMLPVQMLSGYPYSIIDEDSKACDGIPFIKNKAAQSSKLMANFPNSGKVDVFNTFKDIGIKLLTNADVKKPCLRKHCRCCSQRSAGQLMLKNILTDSSTSQQIITIRKYFPETWIWDLVPVSQSGSMTINKTVPDSITTWQADAFCTSPIGFGVASKSKLTAFQPFFVSLTLPSSIIRGEVFTLKATVFNYLQSCMMVNVSMVNSQKFLLQPCSTCNHTQCLCAGESWTISGAVTPLVLGEVSFKVTAEAMQSSALCGGKAVTVPEKGRIDTVIKTLLVLAEGTKQSKSYNTFICLSDSIDNEVIELPLPEVYVEGSATGTVSVVGDLMGRALQNLASLLAMPSGCGEQNMLHFAPDIFILEYLESTNQLTPAIRSTAENFLVSGYQRELTYKHTDGSYSAFGMSDASGNTWLTAFVMKSFGQAKQYIFVDQVFVDQAKTWLGQQQKANGCFASVGQLFHSDLKGGVNDEVTLSAYITAAMLELSYPVTDPVLDHSLTCLRNAYTQVNSIYAKALLFTPSHGGRHWSRVSDGSVTDSLEVEMTSYVLLGLMSGPQISRFNLGYSSSIVKWISQQQNAFGGFASTQDTVVALQALARYSLATYSPAGTLTVTLTSSSGQITTFIINQSNRLLYQESQLPKVPDFYDITAEGTGCVSLQFTVNYNIPPPPDSSSFTISASASGNCRLPNPSLKLNITVRYGGKRAKTNMVVIEVKPLSGFRVDETSVQLVNNKSDVTQTFNRSYYLYTCIQCAKLGQEKVYTLTITQTLPVNNLKPAVVKVYDYYEISEKAATSYTSPCAA